MYTKARIVDMLCSITYIYRSKMSSCSTIASTLEIGTRTNDNDVIFFQLSQSVTM